MGNYRSAFNKLKTAFLGKREVSKEIKAEVVKKVVRSTIIYSSESWTLTKKQESQINAMEMRFLRRIENENRKHILQLEPIN